jgi:hypothetical protein
VTALEETCNILTGEYGFGDGIGSHQTITAMITPCRSHPQKKSSMPCLRDRA